MKKILFILMTVIGFTVSAQEKVNKEVYIAADKATVVHSKEIANFLQLDNETFEKVSQIMRDKYNIFVQSPDISEERMGYVIESTLHKLKQTLTETQYKELLNNEKLYALVKSTKLEM